MSKKRLQVGVLTVIVMLGVGLRLWGFPVTPDGLNQDELSAGYEAYSLLVTGADRWGNHLPAYFSSWGSGMNVLYSYLTIPAIALLGLTPLAVRIVAVVLGIATIPLLYVAVRYHYGKSKAALAALFLAVSQWHVIASRWGLESNLLPVFILLGVVSFTYSLKRDVWRPLILVALVPFALSLYAYGIGIVVVAILLPLLVLVNREKIFSNETRRYWLGAVVVATIVAAPFMLSQVKTYIAKEPLPIERYLPFSIPSVANSRFSEVGGGNPVPGNMKFILAGFDDGLPWNIVPGFKLFTPLMIILAAVAIFYRTARLVRSKAREASPFLLWIIACIPLFLIVPLNINRSNALYLPLIVFIVDGIFILTSIFKRQLVRNVFIVVCVAYIIAVNALALKVYFSPDYAAATKNNFVPRFGDALGRAHKLAVNRPLYVTKTLGLNYMQVLWYQKVNPVIFQHSGSSFDHQQFENYYFTDDSIPKDNNFAFVLRDSDPIPCSSPRKIESVNDWKIGICNTR